MRRICKRIGKVVMAVWMVLALLPIANLSLKAEAETLTIRYIDNITNGNGSYGAYEVNVPLDGNHALMGYDIDKKFHTESQGNIGTFLADSNTFETTQTFETELKDNQVVSKEINGTTYYNNLWHIGAMDSTMLYRGGRVLNESFYEAVKDQIKTVDGKNVLNAYAEYKKLDEIQSSLSQFRFSAQTPTVSTDKITRNTTFTVTAQYGPSDDTASKDMFAWIAGRNGINNKNFLLLAIDGNVTANQDLQITTESKIFRQSSANVAQSNNRASYDTPNVKYKTYERVPQYVLEDISALSYEEFISPTTLRATLDASQMNADSFKAWAKANKPYRVMSLNNVKFEYSLTMQDGTNPLSGNKATPNNEKLLRYTTATLYEGKAIEVIAKDSDGNVLEDTVYTKDSTPNIDWASYNVKEYNGVSYIVTGKNVNGSDVEDVKVAYNDTDLQTVTLTYTKKAGGIIVHYVNAQDETSLKGDATLYENVALPATYDITSNVPETIKKDNVTFKRVEEDTQLTGDLSETQQEFTIRYRKVYAPLEESIKANILLLENNENKSYPNGKFGVSITSDATNNAYGLSGTFPMLARAAADTEFTSAAFEFLFPGTYSFTITPSENDSYPGVTLGDPITVTYEVADENNALVIKSKTFSETNIKHTYVKPELDTFEFKGTVAYMKDGVAQDSADKVYTFALTQDAQNPQDGVEGLSEEVTVTSQNGAFTFPKYRFVKEGKYIFHVSQVIPEKSETDDTEYDSRTLDIIVHVTNDEFNEQMVYEFEQKPELAFENRVGVRTRKYVLPVEVLVNGTDATSSTDPYTIQIDADNDKNDTDVKSPLPANNKLTIEPNSIGNFEPITFTASGVYHYTVRQVNMTKTNIKYDTTVYNVTLTVREEGTSFNVEKNVKKQETEDTVNRRSRRAAEPVDSVDIVFNNTIINTLRVYYHLVRPAVGLKENQSKVMVVDYDLSTDQYIAGYQPEVGTNILEPVGTEYIETKEEDGSYTRSNPTPNKKMVGGGWITNGGLLDGSKNYFWSFVRHQPNDINVNDGVVRGARKIDGKLLAEMAAYPDNFKPDEDGTQSVHLYANWENTWTTLEKVMAVDMSEGFQAEIYTQDVNTEGKPYERYKFEDKENPLSVDKSDTLHFYSTLEYDALKENLAILYSFTDEVTSWTGDMIMYVDARVDLTQNVNIDFQSTWLRPNEEDERFKNKFLSIKTTKYDDYGNENEWILSFDKDYLSEQKVFIKPVMKDGKLVKYEEVDSGTEGAKEVYKAVIPTTFVYENMRTISLDDFMQKMTLSVADPDSGEKTGLNAYISQDRYNEIASSDDPVIEVAGVNDIKLRGFYRDLGTLEAWIASGILGKDIKSGGDNLVQVDAIPAANTEYIRLYPSGRANIKYVLLNDETQKIREDANLWGRSVNPNRKDVKDIYNYNETFWLYDMSLIPEGTEHVEMTNISNPSDKVDVKNNESFMFQANGDKEKRKYVFAGARKENGEIVWANDVEGLKKLLQNQAYRYDKYEDGSKIEDNTQHYTFLYSPVSGDVVVRYYIKGTDIELHEMNTLIDDGFVGQPYDSTPDSIRYPIITIQKDGKTLRYRYAGVKATSDLVKGEATDVLQTVRYEYELIPDDEPTPTPSVTPEPSVTPTPSATPEPSAVIGESRPAKTGIQNSLGLYVAGLLAAIAVGSVAWFLKHKK